MARHHSSYKSMSDKGSEHTTPKRDGSYYVNGAMFHGNHDFANMPSEPTMKYYPKPAYSGMQGLDDTIVGVDEMQHDTSRTTSTHLSNLKV